MSLLDTIPKNFDPASAASRWQAAWEQSGAFTADPQAGGPAYTIVIPPPNVTGSLHMGHALNNTLQDVLVRYKRMDGFNTLWVPGTDHAGIATQWVVERMLRAEGIDRRDLGREAFLERVWAWKAQSGSTITHQLRQLGVSCDWSRERFTMDEGLSRAVREVFVRYHEQGLIYRAERLVNWDPVGLTALSDLEVEAEEDFLAELWSFAYPLAAPVAGPDGPITEIVVSTTRPETMLGDTAIAVHPEDPRYKALIGKSVRHPFVDREIPIVGDAILVDPAFGTGAVKVTPAHDFNDFEVGKRHKLPMITIFTPDAKVNAEGGRFAGMDRFDARKAVKAAIAELGLDRGAREHRMALPRSQRSGAVVEPMLSTQWYVKMAPLAAPALAAVEHGATRFVPKQWENTYYAWMRNIKDWCISRQLWWGHRIPAWHCAACGGVSVAVDAPAACTHCGSAALTQDEDVLDTWFSSALWPFSTMGWPDRTADLARYYPTSVLVTGFDIIFFWVARMMVSGLHFMGQVPFRDVYIHALVRDEHGQKMSKTKGNVVDPLDVIAQVGCDAFRFTLVSLAAQGRDILWSPARADANVKFQNKIWQAFRFALMHLDGHDDAAPRAHSVYDRWILARAGQAVARVRTALDEYRFNEAASEVYAFVWDELCDWYIELSKGVLYNDTPEGAALRNGARHTLRTLLDALARLLHPFMPFLSEELWSHLPGTAGLAATAAFPKPTDFPEDPAALAEVARLQEVIVAVRRVRAEMELPPRAELTLRSALSPALRPFLGALKDLARVTAVEEGGRSGVCATAVAAGHELFLPLEGVIDLAAERSRLEKEIEKIAKDEAGLVAKLNPGFRAKAPPAVLAEFEGKLGAARTRLDALRSARAVLGDG
jgi:valyl-tRNA synthetase